MSERQDLRIDLGQFYGRQPVGFTRDDFNKVQNDIINNSFDGGTSLYKRQMEDLNRATEGKVLVDQNEIDMLRRKAELSSKYFNQFSNQITPNSSSPYSDRPITNEQQGSSQAYQQQQQQVSPDNPPTQSPYQNTPQRPNEGETNEDFFANLFKDDGASGNTNQQPQTQAQAPQTPDRDQPYTSQPKNEINPNEADINTAQIRNEFYAEAIKRGIDPAAALQTLQSLSISDFLEWYHYKKNNKRDNVSNSSSPLPAPSLRSLKLFGAQSQETQPQRVPAQDDRQQRGPSLHELPEPQHPIAGRSSQPKINHIFG